MCEQSQQGREVGVGKLPTPVMCSAANRKGGLIEREKRSMQIFSLHVFLCCRRAITVLTLL